MMHGAVSLFLTDTHVFPFFWAQRKMKNYIIPINGKITYIIQIGFFLKTETNVHN